MVLVEVECQIIIWVTVIVYVFLGKNQIKNV